MINNLDYEKIVCDLYQEILLRQPDKTGLYYFVSQLKSEKISVDDIKKLLLESEEGKSIQNFSHYTDKYWNDLQVVNEYKNKLSTDNQQIDWINDS